MTGGSPLAMRCTLSFGDIYGQVLAWMVVIFVMVAFVSPLILFAFVPIWYVFPNNGVVAIDMSPGLTHAPHTCPKFLWLSGLGLRLVFPSYALPPLRASARWRKHSG